MVGRPRLLHGQRHRGRRDVQVTAGPLSRLQVLTILFSFGVFLPVLKEYFKAGSGEVSTIISIQMGVTFGSGYDLDNTRSV